MRVELAVATALLALAALVIAYYNDVWTLALLACAVIICSALCAYFEPSSCAAVAGRSNSFVI